MILFTVFGGLIRDPEQKKSKGGNPYVEFTIAGNVGYGGNKDTIFVRVMDFNERSGKAHLEYLTKGSRVGVYGEPKLEAYIAKDGTAKASITMISPKIQYLGKAGDGESKAPASQASSNVLEDDLLF